MSAYIDPTTPTHLIRQIAQTDNYRIKLTLLLLKKITAFFSEAWYTRVFIVYIL